MRWRLVVSAVAFVLAGCSGALAPGDTDGRTLTPAAVPDEPPEGSTIAPGVTTDHVRDPDVLADAHRRTLATTSYQVTRIRTIRAGTETLDRVERNATVAADSRAYSFTEVETATEAWPAAASYARIDIWYSEPVVRNRFIDDDRTPIHWGINRSDPGGPLEYPSGAPRAATVLSAVEFRVVETTAEGYHLVATGRRDDAALGAPASVSRPRNVSLTATLDGSGLVRAYDLSYDVSYDGRTVTITESQRVTALGTAVVPKPSWLRAANESVRRNDA